MKHLAFHRSDLIRCTQGTLFGANTPKLPSPPLLAFDHVLEMETEGGRYGHGYAIAAKHLASMNWVFASHFPEDPVMPGTMLVEGLLQLAGFFGAYIGGRGKGRAARIDDVRFLAEVTPKDDEVLYRIDVRRRNADHTLLIADGRITARDTERVTVGSLTLVVVREQRNHLNEKLSAAA
jgi:3-hydroxyacyl-[acyl-carrier protein] dehydratase/trans-2-decenoyl-[acyl-carrier protein] isomerase